MTINYARAASLALVAIVAVGCVSVAPASSSDPSIAAPSISLGSPAGSVVALPSAAATTLVTTPEPVKSRRPRATPTAPLATATPSASPTDTPTATPTETATPTATATATAATDAPTVAPTLNFSATPNYGSTALTSGFVPDPHNISVSAGGSVNVSYLGGSCSGYATSAPDYSVNYTAGAFPLLRFYFIGTSGDSTMIVNSPSATYTCVDDSFGTLNPTVDFESPQSGRYDIWVGTFASGTSTGGTLYVTENSGNHP